jgi:3-keto steroid reductase
LVLACRSQTRAEEAKNILLTSHEAELQTRKEQGISVRPGWKEGLRIDFEQLDLETPGGKAGILSFCNRVKKR